MGPIGVFDSGYGGLTVLSELKKLLPQYDYLYLGDNARAPYGTRSFDVVYEYTLEAVKELFARDCSLVIIACNTASAKALRTIQQKDLPSLAPSKRVLGVIRPSAEEIGKYTKTNHVGILATEGTVRSQSYLLELAKFSPETVVVQHSCPMWVPLIENNRYDSIGGKLFIHEDLELLLQQDAKIDTIVLACTHYPHLQSIIEDFLPEHIKVLSQGPIVAEKLSNYLERHPEIESKCTKNGSVRFLTTENASTFDEKATLLYGEEVKSEHIHYS